MSTQDIRWHQKPFNKLSLREWHDILQLRIEVFVVEQDCPYPELDGKDIKAIHVYGTLGENIVAVGRILPPGISYEEVSIGRVAIAQGERGGGLGRKLMEVCLQAVAFHFGNKAIRISAQTYLVEFYQSLGFRDTGKHYLEDGIPHVEMYRESDDKGC